jgi:N-formylglutamate deformylase
MADTRIHSVQKGTSPLIAVATHSGHEVRQEVAQYLALDDALQRREEDPYTGSWTVVAPSRIIVYHSRFEVDLNRPPDGAVYRQPEDAWGLQVWREPLPDVIVGRSMMYYDRFYEDLRHLIGGLLQRHPVVVVLDLHTYNHRRDGAGATPADPAENPEVNVGTGTMDRQRWAPIVERFQRDLGAYDFLGRHLDVRENVRFRGGYLPRWIHETFPERACALAVEVKKFFMDEWSGEVDLRQLDAIRAALGCTVPGILEVLERYARGRVHGV